MKKLQNSFNDFLPMKYFDFHRQVSLLSSNKGVVAELLRICCEEEDVRAIKLAFERILGKPEKVVVIKHTIVRTVFPDAKTKALTPVVNTRFQDETAVSVNPFEGKLIIDEENAPGILLRKMLDKIGDSPREYAYEVLDKKDYHTVAEVMVANLYAMAMRGANLAAITMLFDYLDGCVADVIRLDGEDTIMLENWADVAPYEAKQGEDGVWYIETEAVK